MFWNAFVQVARKEFIQHFRTKRLLFVGLLLLLTMGLATVVGPKLIYEEQRAWESQIDYDESGEAIEPDYSNFQPNPVMTTYLAAPLIGGFMFLQLMAIILTSDSVCSEWQNRTIFLLLSKPVPRSAFILGKFAGTVGALSLVILVVVLACYVGMNLLLPEGEPGDGLAFMLAAGVLLLGAAGFAAFSLFMSTVTRSTIMSTLAGLGAWLLLFPVLGSVGYFVAIADEDFRNEGQFDWDAAVAECGHEPAQHRIEDGAPISNDEEVAAYKACIEPYETAYRQYYLDRGLTAWFDHREEWDKCDEAGEQYEAENPPRYGEWTHEEEKAWHDANPRQSCHDAMYERAQAFELQRERIAQAKWDAPRVDWSRYLSPSTTMTIAEDLLRNGRDVNPYDELALSPQTIFEGADSTPSSIAGGLVALVAFAGAFLAVSIVVVNRRDFE